MEVLGWVEKDLSNMGMYKLKYFVRKSVALQVARSRCRIIPAIIISTLSQPLSWYFKFSMVCLVLDASDHVVETN